MNIAIEAPPATLLGGPSTSAPQLSCMLPAPLHDQ